MNMRTDFQNAITSLSWYGRLSSDLLSMEQMSWMLFLKYLYCCEQRSHQGGSSPRNIRPPVLDRQFCWSNWACPTLANGKADTKRQMVGDDLIEFVNEKLFPYLKEISNSVYRDPNADPKSYYYKIGNIFHFVPNRIKSGKILREVLDFVDTIDFNSDSIMREFCLLFGEQLKELLKSLFANVHYTPRPLIRSIIRAVDPKVGETVYDPGFGTGGFLIETIKHIEQGDKKLSMRNQKLLLNDTIYGLDRSPSMYLIGLVNMILHGIEYPNLFCSNALSSDVRKTSNEHRHDIVIGNLPFRYDVAPKILKNFPIRHRTVEVLYLQHVMNSVKPNGRIAVIVPEYFLGKADKKYKQLRKELLENFDLHTVLCLSKELYAPYLRMKTNVLFLNQKGSTSNVWYYDMEIKRDGSGKILDDSFSEFESLCQIRATTDNSWMVPVESLNEGCDLTPKNPAKTVDGRALTRNKNKVKELKHLLEECKELLLGYLENWFESTRERQTVGDLIKVSLGVGLPEGENLLKNKTKHPFLKVGNFTDAGTVDVSELEFLSQKTFNEIKKPTPISEFDLYVSIVEPVGLSGIVPSELNGAVLSSDAVQFAIKKKGDLDLKYLYLFTLTSDFLKQFDVAASGVYWDEIELAKFRAIEVPICPIEEQVKLVEFAWSCKSQLEETEEFVKKQIFDDGDSVNECIQNLKNLKLSIEKSLTEYGHTTDSSSKKLSNPFSTGGGGTNFEVRVQSHYVTLLLTNGQVPCLPSGKIEEIKLQGRIDGYNTDDIIVFTQDPQSLEKYKLLGQVKHSIRLSKGSDEFKEVIRAAWSDFNNAEIFEKNKDALALMTGPMSASDKKSVGWLLNHAKVVKTPKELIRDAKQSNFSPPKCSEKLDVIRYHLKEANQGKGVSDEDVFEFLRHFHLVEFDFESETGVLQSMILSNIAQYSNLKPREAWALVVNSVQSFNHHAGTITKENLPKDLQKAFQSKEIELIPEEFKSQPNGNVNWSELPHADVLAKLALIGSWNDENDNETSVVEQLLDMKYSDLQRKAGDIVSVLNSPLEVKNNIWTITNKERLLKELGEKIFIRDLKRFEKISKSVLGEPSPEFDLPVQDRFAADLHGKAHKFSDNLCHGISDGLALLRNRTEFFKNCNASEVEAIPAKVLRSVLKNADWRNWCTLNDFIPVLAESAPEEFLKQVNGALTSNPSPIDEIFRQEDGDLTGENYMTGILWALETLAWKKEDFVSACATLGELAIRDPGGNLANRAFNSLTTILLPWLPQTQASSKIRTVAVTTILKERPQLGWKLLLNLLPYKKTVSSGTRTPKWRTNGIDDFKKRAIYKEFYDESNKYSVLAAKEAERDAARISDLINCMDFLTEPAISKFIGLLESEEVSSFSEVKRTRIWENLKNYVTRFKRNPDAKFALTKEQFEKIEEIIEKISPMSPNFHFKRLFSQRDHDLYSSNGNWEKQREELLSDRAKAVEEILDGDDLHGVIRFATEVDSPEEVGRALASMANKSIESELLSNYLSSGEDKVRRLVREYVCFRFSKKRWKWVDHTDWKLWSAEETASFLTCLPFEKNTWERVQSWLKGNEYEYWKLIVGVQNISQKSENMNFAIKKLIQYGQPKVAIQCLHSQKNSGGKIDRNLTVQALLANVNSNKLDNLDRYRIEELIEHLQSVRGLDQDTMVRIEWAYLPLLERYNGPRPLSLFNKLSTDPEFFCMMIQQAYHSKNEMRENREATDSEKEIALRSFNLLQKWKKIPGSGSNGSIDLKVFETWMNRVSEICRKSGHLQVALNTIGRLLVDSPKDADGLWINRKIANVLDQRDYDDLRDGYSIGKMNGDMSVAIDSNCAEQKKRAKDFQNKADEIESEGFHRFATTLRGMAESERKQAEMLESTAF